MPATLRAVFRVLGLLWPTLSFDEHSPRNVKPGNGREEKSKTPIRMDEGLGESQGPRRTHDAMWLFTLARLMLNAGATCALSSPAATRLRCSLNS